MTEIIIFSIVLPILAGAIAGQIAYNCGLRHK